LRWAARLARDARTHLHVVRVLPEEEDVGCALGSHNALAILRAVEHTLVSHRATCSWLRQLSSADSVPRRFSIVRGEFVTQVARYVEQVQAQLLLLPPRTDGVSELVAELSARTRTPVLVSRRPCTLQTIVAATDLRDSEYPVLRFAGALGGRLNSDIVAVHNLDPQPVAGSEALRAPADVLRGEPGRAAGMARLRRASQQVLAPVQAVVRDDADPVDAILDEARARDAHLVVVGLRPGRRRSGVAARVVDLAQRSVLVIPISHEGEP
jgi:nucleotide-binding universal stress UspA family protein